MIIHHEFTIYYPQGNGHTKWANKILKQILIKLINANQNDWDIMLTMASWAYQLAFRITTQHNPCELIYELMLLLPTKILTPMNWTSVKQNGNMENTLLMQMKNLVLLNEKHYCLKKYELHPIIMIASTRWWEKSEILSRRRIGLWLLKDPKIRKINFNSPMLDHSK